MATLRLSAAPEARFFRDAAGVTALAAAARALPEPQVPGPFRVWVSSGSAGEDAFSAAIALKEALGARSLRVFATARDASVVARARLATFSAGSVAVGVSPERRARWFEPAGRGLRVRGELSSCCVFAVHDLAENLPFVRLDAVYCPMPLGRLGPAARDRALGLFHFALKPGGLLLLGAGERLSDARFAPEDRGAGVHVRSGPHAGLGTRELGALLGQAAAALRGEWRGADGVPDAADERRLRDEFVAMVSHELSTPLAAILGYTETLRSGVRDARQARKFLSTIEGNARRLMTTVDTLVGFTERRFRDRSPQPVALGPAARAAARAFVAKAKEARVAVRVSIPAGVFALVDPGDLPHVLENLIGNAIKYNRRGGTVMVAACAQNGKVTLTVRDTGEGIPAESLPRVFDRFYRCSRAGARQVRGSGLGLSIVRGLVEANGGRVAVESRVGRGSCFAVTLPAA